MENQFKPRICLWEDLSFSNTEKLQECEATVEDVKKELTEILGMSNEDKQSQIELDLYTQTLLYAKTNDFTAHQMSAFFTIIKSVHMLCCSTPFDNQHQALELFNKLLISHGVARPPYSLMVFSLQQIENVSDYVLSTYFKHYKLYKYAFTKKVRLSLRLAYEGEYPPPTEKEVNKEEEKNDGEDVEEEKVKEEPECNEVEEPEIDKEAVPSDGGESSAEAGPTAAEEGDHHDLKDIVSSTLSKKLKDLEVSIEQEIDTQERKLAERISSLEKKVAEKKHKKH